MTPELTALLSQSVGLTGQHVHVPPHEQSLCARGRSCPRHTETHSCTSKHHITGPRRLPVDLNKSRAGPPCLRGQLSLQPASGTETHARLLTSQMRRHASSSNDASNQLSHGHITHACWQLPARQARSLLPPSSSTAHYHTVC